MGAIIATQKKQPSPPPLPAAPQPSDFRSEITGIEQTVVRGPDGKMTIIEKNIKTPEQIEEEKKIKTLIDNQLMRIDKLTNNFVTGDINGLSEILDNFKNQHLKFIQDNFQSQTNNREKDLAKFGINDSSAATQLRSLGDKTEKEMISQVFDNSVKMEQDIRNSELDKAIGLYNTLSNSLNNQNALKLTNFNNINNSNNNLLAIQNNYNKMIQDTYLAKAKMIQQENQAMIEGATSLAGMSTGSSLPFTNSNSSSFAPLTLIKNLLTGR